MNVVLRQEAKADLVDAYDWYDEQQAQLGERFLTFVEDAISRIQLMPQMYVRVTEDVRRAKVSRFPYLVYYRVLPDRIELLAVLHSSRSPQLWRARVELS